MKIRLITTIAIFAIATLYGYSATIYRTNAGQLNSDGTVSFPSSSGRINVGISSKQYNACFAFTLPSLPEGKRFATADFSTLILKYGSVNFNGDLYGLSYRTTNSLYGTDYYAGSLDPSPDATLLQAGYCYPGMSGSDEKFYTTTNSTAIAEYLNEQYEASLADREAGETISVFFRVSLTTGSTGGSYRYYKFRPKTYRTDNQWYWTRLTYTLEDLPPSGTVLLIQ